MGQIQVLTRHFKLGLRIKKTVPLVCCTKREFARRNSKSSQCKPCGSLLTKTALSERALGKRQACGGQRARVLCIKQPHGS